MKKPREKDLGSLTDFLVPGGGGDGHIPRNARLTLLMIDLLQPYVHWVDTTSPQQVSSCDLVALQWEVGGALTVDLHEVLVNGIKQTSLSSSSTRWTFHADLSKLFKGNYDFRYTPSNSQYLDRAKHPFVGMHEYKYQIPAGSKVGGRV